MRGGKYAKTLAKIRVRGIFRIRDIRSNVLPEFIGIFMETPCWCPPEWALGILRYPGRGGKENVSLPEKAWSEDAVTLAGKTN